MVSFNQPWNEQQMGDELLERVKAMPRRPLTEDTRETGCGLYVCWLSSDNPLWGQLGTGTSAAYCGSSVSLAARLNRHRTSLREAEGISVEEVWYGTLPTSSIGSALFAEWLAIERTRAVWNEIAGLGSARPGSTRRGKPSLWDCLTPRSWVRRPTAIERGVAAARLAQILAEPDRLQELWRPLPRAP